MHLGEFELCAEADPGPSDYKMRQNFANALETARTTGKRFRVASIYEDVIAKQTFLSLYAISQIKMAFIMRPVIPHHAYFEGIFKEGLRKLFTYVKNHDLDPKTMSTFLKIVDKAADRSIGAVAQRIDMNQKQLVKIDKGRGSELDVTPDDPRLMQAKIDEMQERLKQLTSNTIDIEPS